MIPPGETSIQQIEQYWSFSTGKPLGKKGLPFLFSRIPGYQTCEETKGSCVRCFVIKLTKKPEIIYHYREEIQ